MLKDAGINIVAISYDPVDTLAEFAKKNEIGYPLLSDEGSKTIDAFGIRNKEAEGNPRFAGIPHPGTYILSKDGIILGKLFKEKYAQRHDTEELITLVKEVVK